MRDLTPTLSLERRGGIKKVLVLGSGALKIGEAGEFDYSGSQAMKALREEGIKIILVNPNIATIQTSPLLADEIYFLPVTPYFVERVIEKERPDGIFLSFGGQTALNCGLALHKKGVLKKYGVAVLGTPIEAIVLTEDRQKFADHLKKINISVPKSKAATNLPQALKIAKNIGYPVMVRAAYALGGQKSGMARSREELEKIARDALAISSQILVEKYLHHYKELEYEVVRDAYDNCVTVCNMENLDPLGIHTGDSIVVAPSQTLTNDEYHLLREASIKIVRSLGIVGECNVQYAVNPHPSLSPSPSRGGKYRRIPPPRGGRRGGGGFDFEVIEVNARLSRSSALASKATGYPLAYVAAKLALGKSLLDVQNQVTKVTQSFFEPALDYVVVKIPRWDLEKFRGAEEKIGSAMKSVGEVMAVGRTFEEALQKAVRMLHGRVEGVTDNNFSPEELERYLRVPTPKRLFALASAIKRNVPIRKIKALTGIDPWFLYRVKNIVEAELGLARNKKLETDELWHLKQLGFSDRRIAHIRNVPETEIRKLRKKLRVTPSVFQIDTLAGEVPAKTNYLYLTYNGSHHDVRALGKKSVVVLGSGPYHIGSSVEFDWSCVHTALALPKYGRQSIIINCNPETVSTDYDMSARLYFEELSFETVTEILDFEKPEGVVVSVGGQAPNNLANALSEYGAKLLGTAAENIDRAEDRNKFSALLDRLAIPQPRWNSFTDMAEAQKFASEVGYPVLVRPSYVLSGSAMSVCYNEHELEWFVNKATTLNKTHPVTISKFFTSAREIELDAVAQNGRIQVQAISEHIENAGVHSGDATIVYPTQRVFASTEQKIMKVGAALARALTITGPLNVQFLVKDNRVYVIEANLRASRTFPLLSKATGVNFAEMIVASFYGKSRRIEIPYPSSVVVKSPQFSFARLAGADPLLHVEMASTGEVACFGDDADEALLKSVYATVPFINKKAVLLSLGGIMNKKRFLESAKALLRAGFKIYATDTTCDFFNKSGVKCSKVYKVHESRKLNVLEFINQKKVAFVINLTERSPDEQRNVASTITDGHLIRRATVDNNTPLFTDLFLARAFVRALTTYKLEDLKIKSWQEYNKS
ncbi:MAG: carbamoyl phosphate synthase large subunit [Candidatus Doudnabacteria bacterium RIFCSPHIGHO2_01_FULL_46_14]|uniref:Carbamoyl phosphate synthase arginine-specific large chain n=1 Tax=Candidatus Doudnabacteria bacterium RIFCSPHIGHO2_01_FULL_46_14 TaxID=1817824 RepID=A0A1F5NMU9_9BACT|nr:MAG: carbamoyl phosphate synthase large subunit [Candidatus Doudnabacteria bacterium RIFCSPHIGHO2_01_FULL_46_14]